MVALVPRRARAAVVDALSDTRVVAVVGGRQVGKSTLVREVMRGRPGSRERRLDRASELAAARHDPESFVVHDGLLAIDEIQRAPELMLAVKFQVDDDPRPGRFLLTGSARLWGLRDLPDALVGRSETVELWPFSQGEIDDAPDGFVDAVFAAEPEFDGAHNQRQMPRDNPSLLERVVRGGFPEAVARTDPRRRARFFDAYVEDLIDRDVMQLTEITRRDDLRRVLQLLASRVAQPLNVTGVARDLGLAAMTVERYVAVFEEVFLIKRIPAWTSGPAGRTTRHRKLIAVDSGLAAHLGGATVARLERKPTDLGPLLENFVLSEIARQITWSATGARLHHYRTRDGVEIDGVLEAPDGQVVGIEVKSSSTVQAEDFRHLRHLAGRIPDRFHLGVVLYTGQTVLQFGPGMLAVPVDRLWHQRPS